MLEFFYTIFLLRWSSQLLHNSIKTPQSFGDILKSVAYVIIILYALSAYNVFAEKDITQANINAVLIFLPIVGIFVGVNLWGGNILLKTSQERYDTLHTFKAFGRGFLGVAVVFLFFISLNIIFGFIFLLCCLFWLFLLIGSLFTILNSDTYSFEKIIYLPAKFFETEGYIFQSLGIDGFIFVGILGLVVLLLPFCLSLWVILKKKVLLSS